MRVEDILPLDKGTSSYTSFTLDKRFVDYLMENPKAMEWKVGLIHSHNTMGVFFSNTDLEELQDNAPNHNFYLSLIVNNYMEMEAKVAVYAKAEKEIPSVKFTARNEEGDFFTIEERNFKIDKEYIFLYDCLIKKPENRLSIPKDFKEKVELLINPPVSFGLYTTARNENSPWNPFDEKENKSEKKEDDKLPLYCLFCFLAEYITTPDSYVKELLEDSGSFSQALLHAAEIFQELGIEETAIAESFIKQFDKTYMTVFKDEKKEKYLDNVLEVGDYLETYGYHFMFVKQTVLKLDTKLKTEIENGSKQTKI